MTPKSCITARAVSLSLLEKATLNLRPISWHTGLRRKNFHKASAHGRTLNGSSGSIPAMGEAVTFLTVFPHASRNVTWLASSLAQSSGLSSSLT